MAKEKGNVVSVKVIRTEQGGPSGKLADAELIFEVGAGPLSGLRLIGFAVWERRDGGRNVSGKRGASPKGGAGPNIL